MMKQLKCGIRIEVRGMALDFSEVWEPARIGRQPKGGYPVPGFYVVNFESGGKLAVHESGFRVVGNHA